ncbi:MAG: gfo/Idh/MocA family oxidoreductase, partial [Armatimonadetes bacterium]|nr:gfo/Idh/MocA family oxidoreductase [Armatimonadota bacterium]
FACFESVRRRGRVDLPLTITDNPLVDLVERGEIRPQPRG